MKKTVGRVSPEERDEIKFLFARRNGLNELAKVLTPENSELYERLVRDLGDTGLSFQNWWERMAEKYGWESASDGEWEINFNDGSIYLLTKDI